MGCLCPKVNKTKNSTDLNEQLNEDPAPNEQEDLEANHITIGLSKYQDISQKRKLAEYLLSNDLNIYKRHLSDVKNFGDEEFNALFEGNTDYDFKVPNKKGIIQLAQKFEDNQDLIIENYNKEHTYKWVLQIWRSNILQKLKMEEDETKRKELLKSHKIDVDQWDEEFKKSFFSIINISPIKTLSERMKNYFEADYGTFDELIKAVRKSRKTIEKGEKSLCNINISANLDSAMNCIIKDFIPRFFKQISHGIDNIPNELRNKEKNNALEIIDESVWTESKKNKLIEQVKKIYEKEVSSSGIFSSSKEYEELKNLSEKFNEDNFWNNYLFDENLEFNELTIEDKAKTVFGNKEIKHAILGLSLANLGYSVGHLCQTFMNSEKIKNFNHRFDEIKENFEKHKNKVDILKLDEDVDEAIKLVGEWGANFETDLEDVKALIKEIEDQTKDIENEKNKTILNIIGSTSGIVISSFGALVTEGEDRLEYASASFSNIVSLCINCKDIKELKKAIEDLRILQDKAIALEKEITSELKNIEKKFKELSVKHIG